MLALAICAALPAAAWAAPAISLVTPPANATTYYAVGAVPASSFTCTADATSSLTGCTAVVDGTGSPFVSGASLPATPGSHTLTVTATEADASTATATGTYVIAGAPTAQIASPANGQTYAVGQTVLTTFSCAEGTDGPGISACSDSKGASVGAGQLDTAAPGTHTYTVTATSRDGLTGSQSITYSVEIPPSAQISAPASGGIYAKGQAVHTRFTCTGGAGAPGPVTCADSGGQTDGTGRLDTSTIGPHTYAVTATQGGLTGSVQISYVVARPPTARIASPSSGGVYDVGQSVPTSFTCSDDVNGSGIAACVDSGGARDGSGALNTSSEGPHSYTVTATSRDGQTGQATIDYTVVGRAPQVVITAPVNNAAYRWTAVPAANFACVAGLGSTVQSCKAAVDENAVADNGALPNSFGPHRLTVTATDTDGLTATASATYTVTSSVSLAPVSIFAPRQGARYRLGQSVAARYSCLATGSGSSLKSCVGTVPAGRRINTRTLGTHSFSVSATNGEGSSITETVTYNVIHTSNRFFVTAVRAGRSGAARLRVTLPGPGSVKAVATAWNAAPHGSRKRIVYAFTRLAVRRGGRVFITLAPAAAGRALLRIRGARPMLSVVVAYPPTGARSRVLRLKPFLLR
jgi:hypothetical protein